jgi:geranylgeranyl diphosphate synthase, type II
VPPENRWPEKLHRAIRHSLFAGGKRLRPILCLAAAETFGGDLSAILPASAGFEMIHTYSLIHDDLPALDDDDLRRGIATCHVAFGEATAILAGDALLTHGLGVFAAYPRGEQYAAAKLAVLDTVVQAIGTAGMIGGQMADLEAEDDADPSAELVLSIHENKTGRLIRASLLAGGLLSFGQAEDLARLDSYGRALGLAFQIKDDLLDVEADSATLGKASQKDAAAGKATFPAVLGVERSHAMLGKTIEQAMDAARRLPAGGKRLPQLARFVAERKS